MAVKKELAYTLKGLVVCAMLVVALLIRGIAEDLGMPIPPLPTWGYGGAGMDNLLAVALALAVAFGLHFRRPGRLLALAGLRSTGWQGPSLVLACTLPFWIASAWSGHLSPDLDARDILFTALIFPFAEELVYRGVGFVFLHRALRWPAWLACLVQALCFGGIHWLSLHENGNDEALTVFCLTFLGGLVFALMDALDRYTIWSGLVFHVSLNAGFDVFDTSSSGDGWGWANNALRIVCCVLAVAGLAILSRRRRGVAPGPGAVVPTI